MRDDHENIHPFDGHEDQTPLTPELEALESRLMLDAAQWDEESPDTGTLATYALALANDPPSAPPVTDSKVVNGPAPAPRITPRLRLQPMAPRQPSAWAAYIVTLGIVATMALVLLRPLLLPHTSTVDSPTPTASMTAAATDTPLPTGTPTSPTKTPGSARAGFTVTRVIPALDLVTMSGGGVWVSSDPTTIYSTGCPQTAPINLAFTFDVSTKVNRGWITFRWRTSDGFVSDPTPFPFAGADGAPVIYREWDLPAIQANGAQWVQVEVLAPNPITARFNFQATCQFSVLHQDASATPAAYNCTAGGDQTFTITGTFGVGYAPGSHTITYHWWRSDGTASASQTITVADGAGSVSVPPDHWIIHQADVGPGKSASDNLLADSPQGSPGIAATINLSCP